MAWRLLRGSLLVAGLVGLGVILLAPSSGAHAALRSSAPADGSALDASPDEVVLTFTEEPEASLSSIQVLDQGGRAFEAGAPEPVANDRLSLRVGVPELAQGIYTVTWRVVSAVDGHATAGAFAFGVGVMDVGSSAAAPEEPDPLTFLELSGRWALIAGLLILVGGAAVGLVAFSSPPRALRWYVLAGLGLAAGGLAGLAATQARTAGVALGDLLGTTVGRSLVWRGAWIAVAGLGVVAAVVARGRIARAGLAASGFGSLAAIVAHVGAGHAGAAQTLNGAKVMGQAVHFAAAGVWIGGLGGLLIGIRGAPDAGRAAAVKRFSRAAGIALGVVVVAGGARAVTEVRSWGNLFSTRYGAFVLVKAGLLAILVVLGAVNRYRNVPRASRSLSGLRAVSRIELSVAVLVLVATAVLTSSPPPGSVAAAQTPPPPPASPLAVEGSDFATSVRIRLQVDPGFPGSNEFTAQVADFDTDEPVDAERVVLAFGFLGPQEIAPSELDLQPLGDGRYRATGSNLSLDGRWEITVLVQEAVDSVEATLRLATRCRTQAIRTEGQPTIYTIQLPDGRSAQGYVDPGIAGRNEVHFTFFDAEGSELEVSETPAIAASLSGADPVELEARRLGPGHFVAGADLVPGTWRFDATLSDQTVPGKTVCFDEEIGS
jgi:copper transport protein